MKFRKGMRVAALRPIAFGTVLAGQTGTVTHVGKQTISVLFDCDRNRKGGDPAFDFAYDHVDEVVTRWDSSEEVNPTISVGRKKR